MAYKVEYGTRPMGQLLKRDINVRSGKRGWKLAVTGLIIIIAICFLTEGFRSGATSTVILAANDMVSDVQNGEQVVDAFAQFCKTVLQIN